MTNTEIIDKLNKIAHELKTYLWENDTTNISARSANAIGFVCNAEFEIINEYLANCGYSQIAFAQRVRVPYTCSADTAKEKLRQYLIFNINAINSYTYSFASQSFAYGEKITA